MVLFGSVIELVFTLSIEPSLRRQIYSEGGSKGTRTRTPWVASTKATKRRPRTSLYARKLERGYGTSHWFHPPDPSKSMYQDWVNKNKRKYCSFEHSAHCLSWKIKSCQIVNSTVINRTDFRLIFSFRSIRPKFMTSVRLKTSSIVDGR